MKQVYITRAFNILLAEKGLKVTELCGKAKVSRSAIYKTFGEKATPTIDNGTMDKSLLVFGITFAEFITKAEKLDGAK